MVALNKDKSTFEILVCIGDEKLESRVVELCNRAGYSVNRSCYNFFNGIESEDFQDIPLVITSVKTIEKFPKVKAEPDLSGLITQVLFIGDAKIEYASSSIWEIGLDFKDEEILLLVAKACIVHELSKENARFRSIISAGSNVQKFVTNSPRMREILELVERIAGLAGSVLITGESGTGKSLLARYIHSLSANKKGALISLSCATFPRDLMESELFGTEKGAYTGAIEARAGAVELADKGSLFLDEIGDLPIELQPKLLTFLQEKTTRRLGGTKAKSVSVRVISATNLSLESMVTDKRFRSDLYYRINTFHIHLPPLRERIEDIPILSEIILKRICEERKNIIPKLSNDCIKVLSKYLWPGNIRELENVLEQATAYAKTSNLQASDIEKVLEGSLMKEAVFSNGSLGSFNTLDSDEKTLAEIEQAVIKRRLELFSNNKAQTARSLGVSLKTLYNKLK